MILSIKYKKISFLFSLKIRKKLFFIFFLRKLITKPLLINLSLTSYNYLLLNRILREFGLVKPLINKKDYDI